MVQTQERNFSMSQHHKALPLPSLRFVPEAAIRSLAGGSLFYPGSGDDITEPLLCFFCYIGTFWFVDATYLSPDHPDLALHIEHERHTPLNPFQFIGTVDTPLPITHWKLSLAPMNSLGIRYPNAGALGERYRDRNTGIKFTTHKVRANPWDVLQSLEQISVIFYRDVFSPQKHALPWSGEDAGRRPEGQTGALPDVLPKLVDGGLVVTDGLGCDGLENPYRELARFLGKQEISGQDAMSQAKPFSDEQGRVFSCIGYCSPIIGPTLIWKVTQPLT
jgi:hypothetical protein